MEYSKEDLKNMNISDESDIDMEYDMVPMPMALYNNFYEIYEPSFMAIIPEMMEIGEESFQKFGDELTRKKDYTPNEINRILMKIERYNPGVFREMKMYGMPYKSTKALIKKIIRLTLIYEEN
ncbi:hypothetical protein CLHOM_13620 [Clostridium homopropionicum DSM 5847]|uniref:Uncharacterized protein n=1 Tax=Clostridium homopropionicum DSM 5847 TaxID=1121318 RepID=A0A0L6ZBI7_9CLOT|nr:hypothetical protein [Clostridium homopropionicum]KOA20163.1 hypothetical protein CLHOM_13620 [Clostridium homopropionicum DSM 5847]SFG60751.1 hypothetical protein SAMN04488501_111113 [Clostridium homopropionicum]